MKYSIILPVYNVEKYLNDCLKSLENLDDNLFEIIAVNDGSTDLSTDILHKWLDNHNNMQIINQTNRGLSAARNAGLKVAKGKYVAFIDSDDYVDTDKLKEIFFQADKMDCDICIGDYITIFESNSPTIQNSLKASRDIYSGEKFYIQYYKDLTSVVWRSIYKINFLKNNNLLFYENIFYEDVEFTPRVFICAEKVFYSGISFYLYRKRSNSITTSSITEKKVLDSILIWESLIKAGSTVKFKITKYILGDISLQKFSSSYSRYNGLINQGGWEKVKTLSKLTKYKSLKYKMLSSLMSFSSNNLFHRFSSFMYNYLHKTKTK